MSVHIKRVPQVLSGDNFPAVDPEDGVHFIFDVPQTSFLSSKTVRNDDDTADVTSAREGDMFKYVANGMKWVRVYQRNIPDDSVGLAQLAHGTPEALVSYNGSGAPVERYGLIPFTGHPVGTYQTVSGAPGSGQIQIVAAGTSVVLSRTNSAGTDQNSIMGGNFNNRNYALVLVASSVEYIFSITSKAYDSTNQRWTLAGTWISNDGTSIAASTDCEVRIIQHNTDISPYMSNEAIRDLIAGFITQGTNVTVTHDDVGDTLTIDAAAAVPGATTLYGSVSTNYTTTGSNESLDANRSFADHNLLIFYVTAHDSSPRLVAYAVDRATFEMTGHQVRLYAGTAYLNIERVNDTAFQVPWRNSSSSAYVALAMIQGL